MKDHNGIAMICLSIFVCRVINTFIIFVDNTGKLTFYEKINSNCGYSVNGLSIYVLYIMQKKLYL
jgi:hypothetical protein